MNNTVIEIQKLTNAGKLLALADVTLITQEFGEITIKRIRLIESDNKGIWLSLPQESYLKKDKRNFLPVVELPKKLWNVLKDEILVKYRSLS